MARPFTSEQRRIVAEKLMEFGNLGGAATVIGQFVTPERFSLLILLFGVAFLITFYLLGFLILRGGEIG